MLKKSEAPAKELEPSAAIEKLLEIKSAVISFLKSTATVADLNTFSKALDNSDSILAHPNLAHLRDSRNLLITIINKLATGEAKPGDSLYNNFASTSKGMAAALLVDTTRGLSDLPTNQASTLNTSQSPVNIVQNFCSLFRQKQLDNIKHILDGDGNVSQFKEGFEIAFSGFLSKIQDNSQRISSELCNEVCKLAKLSSTIFILLATKADNALVTKEVSKALATCHTIESWRAPKTVRLEQDRNRV